MTSDERQKLIAQYRDGYTAIAEVLLSITPEEIDARPGPGRWSTREILHHLADSEMTAAGRLRALLAEDRPTFERQDQDEFARRLYYDRPYESALELFRWAREATAELLERLTPEQWLREGTYRETPFGVERWLSIYAGHAHKHARQISEARATARKQ